MPQKQTQNTLAKTQIARTLREHIADKNTVFVFNTGIAVDTWTDFIVGMEGADGWPKTVAGERFMAWDQFKGAAASVQEKDAHSIPSLLRKLFARNLLSKIAGGEKIFEHIINSDYKESALTFTDWLSKILPSLGMWHKLMVDKGFIDSSANARNDILIGEHDTPENRDYLKLYQLYNKFLEKEKLFEPTWQELEFNPSDTHTYIIFYPELLDDYSEYKKVLEAEEKKGKLKFIHIEKQKKGIPVNYYTSMRAELRMTALRILQEHANKTDWNNIAISVPEIENYLPYVERELQLYNIPYVVRAGAMLGKTGAGLIFRKMHDCCSSGFAFADVRSLALDKKFPWKNPEGMQTLVQQGAQHKCFYKYKDTNKAFVDPWIKNLDEGNVTKDETGIATLNLYKQLNKSISAICKAQSFSAIKNNWANAEGFEEKFLIEKDAMDESTNNILSRCVKKLDELIALEKEYPDICDKNISHFEFFLNELETTQYREQTQKAGVSIFPYKLSAMAAIPKQFVLNASQKAITVENPLLTFLPPASRRLLLDDRTAQNDESQAYIEAYNKTENCVFSVAEQTLGGYAIPYATLESDEKPRNFDKDLAKQDYFKQEKESMKAGGIISAEKISAKIKNGFEFYFNANGFDNNPNTDTVSNLVKEKIRENVSTHKGESFPEKIFISQSAMGNFFTCPRKWIFSNILKLKEDTLDTDIFEKYDAGKINHKILELYLLQTERLPTTDAQTKRLFNEEKIKEQIKKIIETKEPFRASQAYCESSLAREILESQTDVFVRTIINFLRWFCQENLYGDWQVKARETNLELPRTGNLVLNGTIDCVLSNEDECSIIDFKNKKLPSGQLIVKQKEYENNATKLDDFQMPMYFQLWQKNKGEEITGAHFVPINIESIEEEKGQRVIIKEGKVDAKTTKMSTLQNFISYTLPVFDEYVEKMHQAIKFDDYSVGNVKKEKCKGKQRNPYPCDYRSICRSIYNTSGSSILSTASTEED